MNKTLKKIVIVLLVGFILWRLAVLFLPKKDDTTTSTTKNGLTSSSQTTTVKSNKENIDKILNILLSINGIKLSDTLFSQPGFRALKDFSLKDAEQQLDLSYGRKNPFLPIGDESEGVYVGSQSTSTPSAPVVSTGTSNTSFVTTKTVSSTTKTTAVLSGEVSSTTDVLERYFQWGKTEATMDQKTPLVQSTNGLFTYTLSGLTADTSYVYRAVIKKKDSTLDAGTVQSFKTAK